MSGGPLWLVYRRNGVYHWRVFGETLNGLEARGTAATQAEAEAAARAAVEALA